MLTISVSGGEAQLLVQDSDQEAHRQFSSGDTSVTAQVPSSAWARIRPVEGFVTVSVIAGDKTVKWRLDDQLSSPRESFFVDPGETAEFEVEWPLWAIVEESV